MRYFNKKELKALSVLESFFNTAVNFGYKHNTTKAENELAVKIYNDAGGNVNTNFACSYCVMQAYKTIGKWYYESKAELEKQDSSKSRKKETDTTEGRAKRKQKD